MNKTSSSSTTSNASPKLPSLSFTPEAKAFLQTVTLPIDLMELSRQARAFQKKSKSKKK